MKRITLLLFFGLLAVLPVLAGGILTNTNQSASYVRMLARDASTDIDAVYFNPAALALLPDGFFLSISNQTIIQNKEVINSYEYLNNDTYPGKITAPLFPGIYAAYKTGKFAFSIGINPVGGGGGAVFDKGLPSFEVNTANLVPGLGSMGVNGYSADIYFEGTSVFWGLQAGISYAINDFVSVYGGGRYLIAKNTYIGHINDMTVYGDFGDMLATDMLSGIGNQLAGAATGVQPIIDAGFGGLTLEQAQGAGIIDAATYAQLAGALTSLGGDPTTLSIAMSQAYYTAGAEDLYAKADATKDVEVDAEQNGTGFTPIVGANFNLMNKKLNIGIKYEFASPLELKNKTKVDGSGMFPDGAITNSEMPGFLSIGASYKATEKLNLAAGYHLFLDTKANWDGKEDLLSRNFIELAFGLEYALADNLLVSAGYIYAQTGATDEYETDLSYSLTSNTIGFGGKFKVNDNFSINLGLLYTSYTDGEKDIPAGGAYLVPATEGYDKDNTIFAIGVDLKL